MYKLYKNIDMKKIRNNYDAPKRKPYHRSNITTTLKHYFCQIIHDNNRFLLHYTIY